MQDKESIHTLNEFSRNRQVEPESLGNPIPLLFPAFQPNPWSDGEGYRTFSAYGLSFMQISLDSQMFLFLTDYWVTPKSDTMPLLRIFQWFSTTIRKNVNVLVKPYDLARVHQPELTAVNYPGHTTKCFPAFLPGTPFCSTLFLFILDDAGH